MTDTPDRRTALLDALSAHVLAHGLQTASLRPLARAAGTSDRMLIYHFGSKDALIAAVLSHIAAGLAADLDAALGPGAPWPTGALLGALWRLAQAPEARPRMQVWLELAAIAAREGGPRREIAETIAAGFLDWTRAHLAVPADAPLVLTLFEGALVLQEAGAADAPLVLTLFEGALVLQEAGAAATVEAALARLEDRPPPP